TTSPLAPSAALAALAKPSSRSLAKMSKSSRSPATAAPSHLQITDKLLSFGDGQPVPFPGADAESLGEGSEVLAPGVGEGASVGSSPPSCSISTSLSDSS